MITLADARGIPLVATNEAFFAKSSMHEAHDALLCIAEGRVLAEQERRRVTPSTGSSRPRPCASSSPTCRKPATTRSPSHGAARSWPRRASRCCRSARKCVGRRPRRRRCGHGRGGLDAAGGGKGADEASRRAYRERLEFELGIIIQMGFPGYFLIVADFIQWAKEPGHSGRAGPRFRRGLAGRLGADASPTLIRCASACCSSVSSIPSACRCRTSTSISARNGATR